MNKFFLLLGSLLVLFLGALFAVPYFVNWSEYRGFMEEQASRVIGRKVRIDREGISLRLLPIPRLGFRNVRIADDENRFARPFLDAEAFEMRFSIAKLLSGTFEATRIELTKPVVTLRVDEAGRGNWGGFKPRRSEYLFVPRNVALPDVRIKDGRLRVTSAASEASIDIPALSGTFSAPTLQGPFRFTGEHTGKGPKGDPLVRKLRLVTGVMADGTDRLPVNFQVEALALGGKFVFEGHAEAREVSPVLTGKLAALFGDPNKPDNGNDLGAFGLQSQLRATSKGAVLSDLALTFESEGRPQSISGRVAVDWKRNVEIAGDLSAAWLDLNRFVKSSRRPGSGRTFHDRLQAITGPLVRWTPRNGSLRLTASIAQAALYDGSVTDVSLALANASDGLTIKRFDARLPGAGFVEVNGKITSLANDASSFRGQVLLRGGSLQRFAKWFAKDSDPKLFGPDGPFLLSGAIAMDDAMLRVSEMTGEMAGTRFGGRMSFRGAGDEAGSFAADLQSARLDLARFGLDMPDIASALAGLRAPAGGKKAPVTLPRAVMSWLHARKSASLRVAVAELSSRTRKLQNVVIDASHKDDLLDVRELNFETAGGARLRVDGRVAKFSKGGEGRVNLLVAARSPGDAAFVFDVVKQVAGPAVLDGKTEGYLSDALLPLRLAGTVDLGVDAGSGKRLAKLVLDGSSGPAVITVRTEQLGGDGGTPDDLRVFASVTDVDGARLFRRLRRLVVDDKETVVAQDTAAQGEPSVGRLTFRWHQRAGRPALMKSRFASVPMSAVFEARVAQGSGDGEEGKERPSAKMTGTFQFSGPSISDVLGRDLVPAVAEGREATAFNVLGALDRDGKRLSIKNLRGSYGKTIFAGSLVAPEVAANGDNRQAKGVVRVSQLDFPAVMRALTLGGGRRSDDVDLGRPDGSAWAEAPFRFKPISGLDLEITFNTENVVVLNGVTATDVSGVMMLDRAGLRLKDLKGQMFGGRVAGDLALKSSVAGATLDAKLNGEDVDLGQFAELESEVPAAEGRVTFSMSVASRGLSPRGLASVARGQGKVTFKDARLARMSPAFVQTAALAELSRGRRLSLDRLRLGLREALRVEALDIGEKTVPLQIENGSLKLSRVEVNASESSIGIEAAIDLDGLNLNALVEVEPKAAAQEERALPAVTVALNGPLANMGAIEPRILFDGLARELSVRKLERDVEDLERLREREQKLAEEIERRRQEAEKRRLEQERVEAERLKAEQEKASSGQDTATASPQRTSDAVEGKPSQERSPSASDAAVAAPGLDSLKLEPLPSKPEDVLPPGSDSVRGRQLGDVVFGPNGQPLTEEEIRERRARAARQQRQRLQRRRVRQRENSFDPFNVN